MNNTLYEQDFYAWTTEQAALLRAGRLEAADVAHLAEEIESMGRSEKRELLNRLVVLLAHLLKWQFQPARRGSSWTRTIREQRIRIAHHLDENPSLRAVLPETVAQAYELALLAAVDETALPETAFPPSFPYTFAQAMDPAYWPDGA